uniref:Uncharacterized protein n=1 Tax=Parascaris equorum TaxID=6256 RepID=A0A914S2V1_PAREQ
MTSLNVPQQILTSTTSYFLLDYPVNEKAHMTAELEKARNVEAEMGTQIGMLQGELMQARSKIRELENKLKELDKR